MYDLILATDSSGGIGKDGGIPWKCSEDLKIFKAKTMGSILIMGRKTYESLPKLPGREIYVLSKYGDSDLCNVKFFGGRMALSSAVITAKSMGKKIFIAGGAQLYNHILSTPDLRERIDTVHLSVLNEEYDCDVTVNTFTHTPYKGFLIQSKTDHDDFTHYELKRVRKNHGEYKYLDILEDISWNGSWKEGRNGNTVSLFNNHMTFNLQDGFPLLTTKKMFFRGIAEELLFFLRGDTDSKKLEEKKVNIWKGNTNREFLDSIGKSDRKEGMMGPMYGYQWRHYGALYDEETGKPSSTGVDQLADVVHLIKNDPDSRRILMTDYNVSQARDGVLYPCHSLILQFYVDGNNLDMFCYNRSQDFFLGVPFNIASSSLLLMIVAKLTSKTPRCFHLSMGDCHIYESHTKVVDQQLCRTPYVFPKLNILKDLQKLEDIDDLKYEDFELVGYQSHPVLKAEMVA